MEVNLHTNLIQTVISHKVFNIFFSKCKALAEAKWIFSRFNTGSLPSEQTPMKDREDNRKIVAKNAQSDTTS